MEGINSEEAQAVGIWALTTAAVTSTGFTFNVSHSMRLGNAFHKFDASAWTCFTTWLSRSASAPSLTDAAALATPLERSLGLTHKWTLSDSLMDNRNATARRRRRRRFGRCGRRRVTYVGRALLVFHYPHLSSFQHWSIDGLQRMEAALDFVRANPDVLIMCSSPVHRPLEGSFCERTWVAAGVSPSRILGLPGNMHSGDMYVADTIYYVAYVTESLRTTRIWSRAGGMGFAGASVPAAARLQPNCSWPPPAARNLVIFAQRTAPRERGFPPMVNRRLEAGIRERLAPGLSLVVLESSNWRTDLHLFRHARAMVGPHGGMFANIAFMPPGSDIIEIATPDRRYYHREALNMGQRYWVVAPIALDVVNPDAHNRVDVDEVLRIMEAAGVLVPPPRGRLRGPK